MLSDMSSLKSPNIMVGKLDNDICVTNVFSTVTNVAIGTLGGTLCITSLSGGLYNAM